MMADSTTREAELPINHPNHGKAPWRLVFQPSGRLSFWIACGDRVY
jgi:hypothetical protein